METEVLRPVRGIEGCLQGQLLDIRRTTCCPLSFLPNNWLICTHRYLSQIHAVILSDCECGASNVVAKRIVGGREAKPHQFPWAVAITRKGFMHCGGALINDRYVLTAGHCIRWTKVETLKARIGAHNIHSKEGLTIGFKEGILHENFTSDYLHDTNDIALLKLEHSVTFDKNILPVCLPNPMSTYVGVKSTVAGWGRQGQDKNPSDVLLMANVFVMRDEGCKQTAIGEHLTNEMLCAYNTNVDACQGDSGGPLVYEKDEGKMEIIGIVSWGVGCARPGLPGVYTKVTSYLDWIAAHSHDAAFCKN